MQTLGQNPWWVGESDEAYEEWLASEVRWVPELVKRIAIEPFSLHFLVGARQVGKTTALKIFIPSLLERGFNPKSIFYYSCDEIVDHRELGELIDNYLSARREWGIRSSVIVLDEITFVEEWWRAIKSRIDRRVFKNDVLLITGSVSLELLRQKEQFPGRKGSGRDFILHPLDFSRYAEIFRNLRLKGAKLEKLNHVEVIDYSKLSTSELKMKLKELEAEYGKEMLRNYDESLRDALALNEYRIFKE